MMNPTLSFRSLMFRSAPSPRVSAVLVAAVATFSVAAPAPADIVATPGGIRFTYSGSAGSVQLAGSFNSWTGEPMDREADGTWSKVVRLGSGAHEYKFVVDGQWISDPDNPVTLGDYGNSAFTLGADGRLTEMEKTSNTPYNARFLITGRTIGMYQSFKNEDVDGRFELRRPSFDTDLNFAVRVNDVLDARILTNINNESENIESFRTRLNFDRGMMHFTTEDLEGWAWDNDAVDDWDNPMTLVGDVGVYDNSFGFDTQGAMLRRRIEGVDVRLLYADNFLDGGQNRPALDNFFGAEASSGDLPYAQLGADSVFAFRSDLVSTYRFNLTSGDEDVLATRAKYSWRDFTFGASGRLDRGYNPGRVGTLENVTADTLAVGGAATAVPGYTAMRRTYDGTERWFGVGGDVAWENAVEDVDLRVEVLYGKAAIAARAGVEQTVFLGTGADTTSGDLFAEFATLGEARMIDSETIDLDRSIRARIELDDLPPVFGVEWNTSVEFRRHEHTPFSTGGSGDITNEAWRWDGSARRDTEVAGRAVSPSLGMEFHYFDYDRSSPWEHQLWFDYRNFWLENGRDKITAERLTLLGGQDAFILRPAVDVEVLDSPRVTFRYEGTVAAPGFGREPSYVETLLQGTWNFRPRWRLHTDLRFAKYNSRPLDLDDSFNSTFLEVVYEVAAGIDLALSYGVDPWVLDPDNNEYGYIGREQYLFARGANGVTARENYVSLAEVIPEAESALADERVIQIEAIVRF